MESTPPPISQPETPISPSPQGFPETPKANLLKPLLFSLLALIFVSGIALTAYKLGQAQSQPIPIPPVSVPPLTPTPTPDETANWKTYTNDLYDYYFKYPNTWFIYDKGITIGTNELRDPKRMVAVSLYKINEMPAGGTSYREALVIQADVGGVLEDIKENVNRKLFKSEETEIGGKPAVKKTTISESEELMGNPSTNYFIDKNGQIFLISFENTDFKGTHNKVFDQILSTFRFLD